MAKVYLNIMKHSSIVFAIFTNSIICGDYMKFIFAKAFLLLIVFSFSACSNQLGLRKEMSTSSKVNEVINELGLVYVEDGAKTVITYEEVNAAQQKWCDSLVKIGKLYEEGLDYKAYTNEMITELYNYDFGKVFFKPTLAYGEQTFRTTKKGAIAYFIGGDQEHINDKGFALKPWKKVRFDNLGDDNQGIQIYGSVAIAMGNVWVTDKDGNEIMVDKTFVFKKGEDGKLRIIVHKSSLPYQPN